jgi:MSHA biogenesis protein MshP
MTFKKGDRLSRQSQQTGFTLITAIFLLVVVALLMSYIVSLRAVQQSTLVYGVQGARAMQAARAGLEWGIYQAINEPTSPTCLASSDEFSGSGAISNFAINVTCTASPGHFEGSHETTIFRLTSTATTGEYGTLDYVFRRLQTTISASPP